jgi:hypothetical protein
MSLDTPQHEDDQAYREPSHFAEHLADSIRIYWAERGYDVTVRVRRTRHCREIESDLVNGFPRDWRGGRVERLACYAPQAPETTRERPCMNCGARFISEHRFHRLCSICRSGNAGWRRDK